jgi:hypothetical protein
VTKPAAPSATLAALQMKPSSSANMLTAEVGGGRLTGVCAPAARAPAAAGLTAARCFLKRYSNGERAGVRGPLAAVTARTAPGPPSERRTASQRRPPCTPCACSAATAMAASRACCPGSTGSRAIRRASSGSMPSHTCHLSQVVDIITPDCRHHDARTSFVKISVMNGAVRQPS